MSTQEQSATLNAADRIIVELSDTQTWLAVDPAWVNRVVSESLRFEGIRRATISVAVMDDASIRVINARHLSHDWATDVISFCFSSEEESELTGELLVSTEMALMTAATARTEPLHELALYLVHGLLHLCGYDDQLADDIAVMRDRETIVLRSLGIINPFDRIDSIPATADHSGRESVRWPR